ncbi:hypothetical protein M405DRAFT_274894 [Rhizopogon salebrosus TDB-379]|nr:hypothetical protein M405DRAFT_274894 [Rhizopogon salebrosus TDB-379]
MKPKNCLIGRFVQSIKALRRRRFGYLKPLLQCYPVTTGHIHTRQNSLSVLNVKPTIVVIVTVSILSFHQNTIYICSTQKDLTYYRVIFCQSTNQVACFITNSSVPAGIESFLARVIGWGGPYTPHRSVSPKAS